MNFLLISAHDYRTPRKAGIHFVAAELARRGATRFFSCKYSWLSAWKADVRNALADRANQVETFEGVECFLWKSWIHPFTVRSAVLRFLEAILFYWYTHFPSRTLVKWIREADLIVFESGIAPVFLDLVKRVNPRAKTLYIASDDLATVGVATYVRKTFDRVAAQMDLICLKSRHMADGMSAAPNQVVIPHGLDLSIAQRAGASPYPPGVHAVSVGSMLFDADFFAHAARQFPQVTFHVIGCGNAARITSASNVRVYEEMPFVETLRYVKHARFGIAPYRGNQVPAYLADTSLKLLQYDFFGLPAVCPQRVVGDFASRFGYAPGDPASIAAAINAALVAPHVASRTHLDWAGVVDRMLNPHAYPEIWLDLLPPAASSTLQPLKRATEKLEAVDADAATEPGTAV